MHEEDQEWGMCEYILNDRFYKESPLADASAKEWFKKILLKGYKLGIEHAQIAVKNEQLFTSKNPVEFRSEEWNKGYYAGLQQAESEVGRSGMITDNLPTTN